MINLLPFEPSDTHYSALVAINQILQPEVRQSAEMLRTQDEEFSAENKLVRILAEVDNQIVAHGAYWHPFSSDEPSQFSLFVHPDHQNGEVPSLMHKHLIAKLSEAKPDVIVSEPTEDEAYRTQLLKDDGFELKMRFPRSQLDLKRVDATPNESADVHLKGQHIEIVTLTDVMQRDPNWKRHVWRMFTIIDQDVPYPDPQKSVPFEQYAKYYEGELFRPNLWTIALDQTLEGEQQYVGMAVVNIMPTRPDTVYAGITGVVPSHRRRKIATQLKLRSHQTTRSNGFDYIYTDNEENNPMYQLNLQLGFEPLPAWVYYQKTLG